MGIKHKLFSLLERALPSQRSVIILLFILCISLLSGVVGLDVGAKYSSYMPEKYLGTYQQSTKIITLYTERQSIQKLDRTYLHERCHKVWFEMLSSVEKGAYKKIYNEATTFVTPYAKTKTTEGFAESCTVYILGSSKLDARSEAYFNALDKAILIPRGYK